MLDPRLLELAKLVLGHQQDAQAGPAFMPMGMGGIHPGAQVADGPLGENARLGWAPQIPFAPPQPPPQRPQIDPRIFGRLFQQQQPPHQPAQRRYF